MPSGFDRANKLRRNRENRETCRHFALWAKLHYKGKTLDDIICKITGFTSKSVDYRSKTYWMQKTCRLYNIDGYDIIEIFMNKSYRLCSFDNEIEQILSAMRAKLHDLRVREGDFTIWHLGEADLFEEE